ncbi:PKD domain-containing protein [Mucilaginibacter calamicampi]|uniref:PKD domain-containing protein n=1 Tax=Mucilaginibacter calamicampi TaxID=1302352 RepID=A0ABW2YXG1_9SPHI
MQFRYFILLICVLLPGIQPVFAQQNAVNVDPSDGSINVGIPIGSVSNGGVSASVSLVYTSGNGVRVKDVEGSAGIGWHVTGGGQITRELRGLPDDARKDNAGNNRVGWLHNSNGTIINSLTLANTGSPNCTNEVTDSTNIHNNFANLSDTEPDVFNVSAPGLSCQFVFDNSHVIKTIPYQDLKITYDTLSNGAIFLFTVVNSSGTVYKFSYGSNAIRKTTNKSGAITIPESSISYFKNEYYQYKYGINYTASWALNTVTDINGNAVNFAYDPGLEQASKIPLELYIGSTSKTTQYWIETTSSPQILSYIKGGTNTISFSYADNYRTSVPMVKMISINAVEYLLNYSPVFTSGTDYYRFFLRNVKSNMCDSPFEYNFSYYGETLASGQYTTILQDSTSKKIDYWGYQSGVNVTTLAPGLIVNPSNTLLQRYQVYTDDNPRTDYPYTINGGDRRADINTINAGALKQITYYNNGSTTIEYESNDFYDPTGSIAVKGGGVRVKTVEVYDGIDVARNIVRNYAYTNPATGATSGKPVTLPLFAFTRPYTGGGTTADKWTASTVRSELDLSNEDHSILYSHVTLSQTGAGKTLYEYFLPATNYDATAHPSCDGCTTDDWKPNLVYVAGPGCFAAGFVSSIITTYPFAPNLNYDFERRLLKKVTAYNDANNKVSESEYTYVRTGTPEVTTAFKYDYDATVMSYLKYNIYTSASELSKQVINRVYDLNSTTLSQQTSESYFYASAYHKLPTQTQSTKSDGTVQNNYIKYSKDYVITTPNDDYVTALYNLQQQNVNTPIENRTELVKGGVSKVTSAGLVKFKPFTFGANTLNLPAQTLSFFDQDGVSSFNPSTITSGLFVNDSRYIVNSNNLIYDSYGFLQTSDDNHKRVQTSVSSITNHLPILSASNATAYELGYYTYQWPSENVAFQKVTSALGATTGRPVQASQTLSLAAGDEFTRIITKNTITQNYIFSLWMKPAGSGSIDLVLKGSDNVPHTYTINFTSTAGVWKYYELKVPVSALSTTFTANFKNMGASAVPIDDVLFYPENTEVVTFDYDRVTKAKIAETNTNGVARYFVSDELARPELVYDQDKQITNRQSYHYSENGPFLEPGFSWSWESPYAGKPVAFSPAANYNTCQFVGVSYTWDFGDSTSVVTVNTADPQTHTYAHTGNYNVTLTVNAPGFGTKSNTQPVTISTAPPPPTDIIPVLYSNQTTTGGSLNSLGLYQSNVLKYSFNATQLATGTVKIAAGTYNAIVRTNGTIGSVSVDTGTAFNCLDKPQQHDKYPAVLVSLASGNTLTITLHDEPCM